MMISKEIKKSQASIGKGLKPPFPLQISTPHPHSLFKIILLSLLSILMFNLLPAQDSDIIASGEVTVQGVRLQVEPGQQTVPINTETIVNTVFSVDSPEVLEGMMVKGTLRGPAFQSPITLTTLPNHPFSIPGLTVKGSYVLENIHLERNGIQLVDAEPAQVTIEAMDVIVTQVETRPLTLEEIREKGIVISEENFSVYNFSVGFVINSEEVKYDFPIVYSGNNEVYIPSSGENALGLGAIMGREPLEALAIDFDLPDFDIGSDEGSVEVSQSISGIVLFNNDIAFLHQFFSVMFIVSNHAPEGSALTLKDLSAQITYPEGLREAETDPPHISGTPIPVRCPGPDGEIGTSDDVDIIMATFSGMAEFLAEGLEEGTHIVKIDFSGTLSGLPSGDTPISGTASGAVIVRNPEFGITFAHPSVIRKGEEYDIFVTMTNTSPVAANLVSLTMPSTRLVGTSLLSDETVSYETVEPGESVDATFHMRANETGKIRASAFEADSNVSGKFVLTAGVGEEGIPLSPDTLVLPDWAYSLPDELINASLLLLGEAYSIATTPPGGLPEGLPYIKSDMVKERAVEFAEAGQRYSYGETLQKTLEVLTLDWLGNQVPDTNFDILRRLTSKGLKFAEQQSLIFNEALASQTAQEFQLSFSRNCSYKSPYFSAILSFPGGSRTAALRVVDYYQNRLSNELGSTGSDLLRNIPYGELYLMEDQNQSPVDFALIGSLDETGYRVEVVGKENDGSGTFDLSLIIPDVDGNFRQVVFTGVSTEPGSIASIQIDPESSVFQLSIDIDGDGQEDSQVNGSASVVQPPALQLISATQECTADAAGHATALFFNRPVDATTAKDKNNYYIADKTIYASYRQPSGRVVLIGTNNPISPFVESRVRVENLKDTQGGLLTPSPVEMVITPTIKTSGGIVYGQILDADSEPVANARVQLTEIDRKNKTSLINEWIRTLSFDVSDVSGNFQFDYVRILNDPFTIQVQDPSTGKVESVSGRLLSNGQRLQMTIIMRGRGTVKGTVMDTNGNPVSGANVAATARSSTVTGGTNSEQFGQTTGEDGTFVFTEVPIGEVGLSAGKGDMFGTAATVISSAGETQVVDITMVAAKYASITGRVLSSDGVTPVAETYLNMYGESSFATSTQTDSQGYFQFPVVPVGTFRVNAYNPLTGSVGGSVKGELIEGQTFNATIILRGSGRVYGKVFSYEGVPQENVLVYISGTSFFMDTDSNGEFDFEGVPVGSYSIRAYHRTEPLTTSSSAKLLSEGQEVYATLVFPNTLKGAIKGTVYDVDGTTPLSNIQVFAADLNFVARGTATSGADGSFQIDNLDANNYIIFAVHGEKCGASRTVVQSPGYIASCDLTFLGKGKINAHVYASDGQTGIMAKVNFRRKTFVVKEGDRIGFYSVEEQYNTDENGNLTLEDVYMGDFNISAENAFYPRGARASGTISSPGEEVDVDLVMLPTGKVRVHVVNWDGTTAVSGAALGFQCSTLKYDGIYSDESGDFEFTLVPPGSFRITAEDSVSGLKGIRYGTMGQDGDLVETTLRLLGQGQVNGVVKNQSGGLIPNVKITLKNIGYPDEKFETSTDDTGHFVITRVWEGEFTVSAYDSISHTGGVARGEIASHNTQANIEVVLDPIGTVTGKVLSPDGVNEMLNCQVVLYHSRFSYAAVGYFYVSEEGGYTFENIPSGQFYIEAFQPASGRKGKQYGSITYEGEVKEVNVNLEGRGTVTGTFFDGSQVNPVPFASIKIITHSQYPFTLVSSTNSEGVFTFENVGEGTFDLRATDPSYGLLGSATGEVKYDGEEVEKDVVAQGWGTVRGVVYHADGSTIAPNSRISIKQGSKTYSTYAGTDGEYGLDFLPTGSFTVYAYEEPGERDYGIASGTLEFHGQVAVADVTFKGLGTVNGQVLDGGGNPQSGIPVTLKSGSETYTVSSGATNGEFQFDNLRMGDFSLEAKEPATNLSGSGDGELTYDGEVITINLTLESAGSVSGRVLTSDGVTPAETAYIKLKGTNFTQYYSTSSSGEFSFNAVRLGSFSVEIQGYDNSGKARVYGEIVSHGDEVNFGDIVLDNVIPQVTEFTPVNGSAAISLTGTASVTFSEAMAASSITTDTVKLTSSSGKVAGSVTLSSDLKTVVYTPASPLSSFSIYTLLVDTAVEDIAGNNPDLPVSASFTTSDVQPPVVVAVNPVNNSTGIPIDSMITVTFDEPVDSSGFTTQNLIVTKGGSPVAGAIAFNEGNQIVVFTPTALESDSVYTVSVQGARDYAGNVQSQVFTSSFSTVDTIAPVITLAGPASGTTVIESSSVQVTVNIGSSTDVSAVHFFLNGELKHSDNSSPYNYTFSAPLISQVGSTFLVEALAEDQAGNQSNRTNLTFTLQADSPPQITLTGPSESYIYPGGTLSCTVAASDDLSLGNVTLTAVGGTLNYSDTQTLTGTITSYNHNYSIPVPSDILPGTVVVLHAEAQDLRSNTAAAVDVSLTVPNDEEDPTVSIQSPTEGAVFGHNDEVSITATASDDVGLKEVRFYLDDQLLATLTQEPFGTTYTVPPLDEEQTSVVKVEAEDLVGKSSLATVNIVLEQLVDLTAPQVKILSPSNGSQVYAGEVLMIKVDATDDEGIDYVDVMVNDQLLQSLTESPYEVEYTVPSDATAGSTITIKAVATDVDDKTGTAQSVVEVVSGTLLTDGTVIEADDTSYDNQTIIINDGTVTINGSHTFANVLVKESSLLTHTAATTSAEYKLEMTITGKLSVGESAQINVNGRGYLGGRRGDNDSAYGYTLGNTTDGGSYNNSGASYGGYGGFYNTYAVNKIYGSFSDPNNPGSGGGSSSDYNPGGSGGGVVRIVSSEIVNDGLISANGHYVTSGGGSGGSIKIETGILMGTGSITANGGNSSNYAAGGGGRIAVYYGDASEFNKDNILAYGGSYTGGTSGYRNAAAGTIYLQQINQEAQLIIDNNAVSSTNRRIFPLIGPGTITGLTASELTDANASFMEDSLIGMELIPDMENKEQTFTIVDNTKTTITVDSADGDLTLVSAIGYTYGGIAVFDGHLIIQNTTNSFIDGDTRLGNLSILSNSRLGHTPATITEEYYLSLQVTGKVLIDATSSIWLHGCGYLGARRGSNTGSYGYTLGNTPTGGSYNNSGASYGGKGGQYNSYAVNEVYGSIYDPVNPGSGGGSSSDYNPGGSGGGVIRIITSELDNNGLINANGHDVTSGGGSGGSIKIETVVLSGGGTIAANGGNSTQYTAGGGGRIAVYYEDASGFNLDNITAYGGSYTGGTNSTRNGGAGTIYLEKKGETGEIIVDNNTISSVGGTPMLGGSSGTITTLEANKLVDANADFIPGSLMGMKVIPNTNASEPKSFTITTNTQTEIYTDPIDGDMTLAASVGDRYGFKYTGNMTLDGSQTKLKGLYRFSAITLLNSTLTIDGSLEVDSLTIQNGSKVTHSAATTTTVYTMNIQANEIVIDGSSSISVYGCGYLGGRRDDNDSAYGYTLGNTTDGGSYNNSGASYGGWGGQYNTYTFNKIYGSIAEPGDPGSGGGSSSDYNPGGSGGGVIQIISSEIVNNGSISANGYNATSGGGSGGSIKIETGILRGSGTITANGGSSSQYAAGGGGRIAVYYEDASEFNLENIVAYGGSYTGGTSSTRNGSAGTVYLQQTGQESQLIVDNNMVSSLNRRLFPLIGPGTITGLTATVLTDSSASFMEDSLIGMELIPDMENKEQTFTIVDNTKTTITIDSADGDLTTMAAVNGTYGGMAVFDGHLIIRNSTFSFIDGDARLGNLSILSNAKLGHTPATTTKEYYLSLQVTGKVMIDTTSSIWVHGCGYLGGRRGDNESSYGYTLGNTPTGGSYNNSGASYGGKGGQYSSYNVNEVYGSLYEPNHPGSGGGSSSDYNPGGSGGGVIHIITPELDNNGLINANGHDVTSGGGSGGSIMIEADILGGSGSITANGGNSTNYAAGGGGRIAIYYEDASGFNLDNITAYGGSYTGGTSSTRNGGAGTVYLKQSTATYGDLIVNNNNVSCLANTTPIPAVGQGFNTQLEANHMADSTAPFIMGSLKGIKLNPEPTGNTLFTIISNTGTDIYTDSADGDMTLIGTTGGAYIGEHLLFNVTVKGSAQVFTTDRIQVSGTLTIETGSALVAENHQ